MYAIDFSRCFGDEYSTDSLSGGQINATLQMASNTKTVSGQFYNWSDAAQGVGTCSFGRYTAVLNY